MVCHDASTRNIILAIIIIIRQYNTHGIYSSNQSKWCEFMPKIHQNTVGGRNPLGSLSTARDPLAAICRPTSKETEGREGPISKVVQGKEGRS